MPLADKPFDGHWITTFGPLALEARGREVSGTYASAKGALEGRLEGSTLRFRYREPAESGEGEFRLLRSGRFVGTYLPDGEGRTRRWNGERGFDGVWDTSFGRMRLMQDGESVHGSYEGPGPSRLDGELRDRELAFRYREPNAAGEGRFALADDGLAFAGEWREGESAEWKPWSGRRLFAEPGVSWLVVLEAHWQKSATEPEYSFGNMLREIFARRADLRVRQRYFDDAEGLERWCRELRYLLEPSIVIVASHGSAHGLSVRGLGIPTGRVLEALHGADAVRLLHFSACLVGLDGDRVLGEQPYPVSGYTTSVDWGASALLEFTYLDLVINRGWEPDAAAAALPSIVPYALDTAPPGSPYPPAGFTFFPGASLRGEARLP
jgi:hypothetical protein